jgi:hypothetical protein
MFTATFAGTLRAVLALTLAAPAWASTWVVDDNAGPGVDFTSISAAVAAASTGDVILVRPGTYGGFTLSSGVLVLGDGNVQVTGPIAITNVGLGPRATVARMTTRTILVSHCTACVTLEDLVTRPTLADVNALGFFFAAIEIATCADVRLRGVDATCLPDDGSGPHALRVDGSRVEITHSLLQGRDGFDQFESFAADGGDGMQVRGASDVHLSLSTVRGGEGADHGKGGDLSGLLISDGGAGIRLVDAASKLLVTSVPANLVRGGQAGLGDLCPHDGQPGNGIVVATGASARVSGATIQGATYAIDCGGAAVPAISGTYSSANPADPSLSVSGTIAQGQLVTYTLHGAPGSAARLRLGRQAVVQDVPGAFEDRLTVPLRTYDLGTLPPSGVAIFPIVLSGALAPGFLLIAQASTTLPSETTLTQSVSITLH